MDSSIKRPAPLAKCIDSSSSHSKYLHQRTSQCDFCSLLAFTSAISRKSSQIKSPALSLSKASVSLPYSSFIRSSPLSSCIMSYNVWEVRFKLGIQDPDSPETRYHTVIFVETNADGSGYIHHVEGELVIGMKYVAKSFRRPEIFKSFHNRELLGKVLKSDYPDGVNRVCEAQPPPEPQKKYNTKTNRTEPIKSDGTFYEPGETQAPMVKCTEWTERRAIPALKAAGILKT